MQATWQALQPMHLVVSMSFATVTSPVPERISGSGRVVAERLMMSSDCSAMVIPLQLLDLDEERLELRRLRVGITDERRQCVGNEAGFRKALEAPVDGNADVVQCLAVHLQRTQPLRHNGDGIDVAPIRGDLDAITGGDAELLAQRLADLYELLRLDDRIQPDMFGPVVEVFREPIGRRRVGELIGLAERLAILVEHSRGRIFEGLRIARTERVAGQ